MAFIEKTANNTMNYLHLFVIIFTSIWVNNVNAQQAPLKIALFAPLHLDEAFDENNKYKYAKNEFPTASNPGLEFYIGAKWAIEQLAKTHKTIEYVIIDTKNTQQSVETQLNSTELQNVQLIIAHCNAKDINFFSSFAAAKQIPVINTNFPNDGNAGNNPYFVVLNPTLYTQCEGIYTLLQKDYMLKEIVLFTKEGAIEKQIQNFLTTLFQTAKGVPVKIKTVNIGPSFTQANIKPYLSTADTTVCIAGSLDVEFGKHLLKTISEINKTQPCTIIGMPTWDAMAKKNATEYKDLHFIYADPFYISKSDTLSKQLSIQFTEQIGSKPSDMFYRGYETTLFFSKMLIKYGSETVSNLTAKQPTIFTNFKLEPTLSKKNKMIDYFENKNLYFLHWHNGEIVEVKKNNK